MSQELIQEAITCFSSSVVNHVIEMVGCSDPDCMYTLFQDMGMYDHADCVEFLFFN